MADLQNTDPIADKVSAARREASRRPDVKFPVGNINYVGNYFYGYAFHSIDNESIHYFEFTTTEKFLVGHMVGGRNMKSGAECTVEIKCNDYIIFKTKWDNGSSGTNNNPMSSPTPFIIPPYTKCVVKLTTDTQDEISIGLIGETKE